MKEWIACCKEHRNFFLLWLLMDFFIGEVLWLLEEKAIFPVLGMFVAVSVLIFLFGIGMTVRAEKEKRRQLLEWLEHCALEEKYVNWNVFSASQREVYEYAYGRIEELYNEKKEIVQMQLEYEDYMEGWAHEIKIPLSLMTLLLENRKEDMTSPVYQKMKYATNEMQHFITQILCYAGLRAVHKDYGMEFCSLREITEQMQEEFQDIWNEKGIVCYNQTEDETIFTDRKGICFILEQIFDNACKYADVGKEESSIQLESRRGEDGIWLSVKDNGIGICEGEVPFLTDKGFTGSGQKERAKSTGMGLYLVAQMAKDLSLTVNIASKEGEWFCVEIGFPIVCR